MNTWAPLMLLKSAHLYYPSINKLLYFKLEGDLDMQSNLSSKPKIINPMTSIQNLQYNIWFVIIYKTFHFQSFKNEGNKEVDLTNLYLLFKTCVYYLNDYAI